MNIININLRKIAYERYIGFLIFLIIIKYFKVIILLKKFIFNINSNKYTNVHNANDTIINNNSNNSNNNNNTNNSDNSNNINKNIDNKHNISKYVNKGCFKNNKKGQLSLEFLLIFFIAIMLFLSVSLPLGESAVDSTFDSYNSLTTKSEIFKIANSIDNVYSNGPGSKRMISLDFPQNTVINFHRNVGYLNEESNNGIVSCEVELSEGNKSIEIPIKANNIEKTLYLSKGLNKISIQWIYGEDIIRINKEQ